MSGPADERAPLLENDSEHGEHATNTNIDAQKAQAHARMRGAVGVVLTLIFIIFLVVSFTVWNDSLSRDPHKAALSILANAPVIVSTPVYALQLLEMYGVRGAS
jgi:hypothetical protein